MGTRQNRLDEAVLTCTHSLCFEQKYEKYQKFSNESFQFLQLSKNQYITWACFRNALNHICVSIFSELDPRLSGLVWTAMLASLALVITIATPSSIITLIASIILRMIFSVGVEPTLWLLGVLNVSLEICEKCFLQSCWQASVIYSFKYML